LTQFTRFSGIGTWLLVCLLGTSFWVRSTHYSKVSR
jgi:hypothetical protein